jgi:hypothetical protein
MNSYNKKDFIGNFPQCSLFSILGFKLKKFYI